MAKMSAWKVETDPRRLRRYGKLMEELGELQQTVARCLIQGIDENIPGTDDLNYTQLWKEIADVLAQIELLVQQEYLPRNQITVRMRQKMNQMAEWEELVK